MLPSHQWPVGADLFDCPTPWRLTPAPLNPSIMPPSHQWPFGADLYAGPTPRQLNSTSSNRRPVAMPSSHQWLPWRDLFGLTPRLLNSVPLHLSAMPPSYQWPL